MRKAIIKPINHRAAKAWCAWPEEVIGEELTARLYDAPHRYFACIIGGQCAGWDVLHGEAELVRFVEEPETCEHCGGEL